MIKRDHSLSESNNPWLLFFFGWTFPKLTNSHPSIINPCFSIKPFRILSLDFLRTNLLETWTKNQPNPAKFSQVWWIFHGFSIDFPFSMDFPWISPAFLQFPGPRPEEDAKVELLKLLGAHPHIREAGFGVGIFESHGEKRWENLGKSGKTMGTYMGKYMEII